MIVVLCRVDNRQRKPHRMRAVAVSQEQEVRNHNDVTGTGLPVPPSLSLSPIAYSFASFMNRMQMLPLFKTPFRKRTHMLTDTHTHTHKGRSSHRIRAYVRKQDLQYYDGGSLLAVIYRHARLCSPAPPQVMLDS